jgi:hypothetical protein
MQIERRSDISPKEFIKSYLGKNRPVVITDAMRDWKIASVWSPEYFQKTLGSMKVSLQGDFFSPMEKQTLSDYIAALPEYESHVDENGKVSRTLPYLRYSVKPEMEQDFGAEALKAARGMWARPYFMPARGYLYPMAGLFHSDPTQERYPGFGVYISPRGAITKLHQDGDLSNAILCQVYGRKRCFLFPPECEPSLPQDREFLLRKVEDINIHRRPTYGSAEPLETILEAGDILFIPRSWFHEVYTLGRSVSLTYNFVHMSEAFKTFGPHAPWPPSILKLHLDHQLRRMRNRRRQAA